VTASPRPYCRALIAAACAGTLAIAGLAAAVSAQASPARAVLAGTHPAWAVPARMVTSPDTAATIATRVYLAGRDPAGLAAFAAAVSDPASRQYRRFLTSGQELRRFGPASAQISAVRTWLTSAGLHVTAVTRHYVAAAGPVSATQAAFAVRLASFRGPGGTVAMAPEQNASVPDAVRAAVLTVTGLDTAAAIMKPALAAGARAAATAASQAASPPAAFYTAGPCSAYYGQRLATSKPKAYGTHVPWALCGYTPQQLRSAYGLSSSTSTGRGVTVAIVDAYASPTMPADADAYARAVRFPALSASQFRQEVPGSYDYQSQCDQSSWFEEESLDVEAVHTMAPGANIEYVGARDCTFGPLLDALASIVDNHLANVVSDSWTGAEQGLTSASTSPFDQVFEQGAAEGIGFNFAAGDCGYNDPSTPCGGSELSSGISANFPTTSTWVTAVGGTSLAIGRLGGYKFETSWGDMVVPQHQRSWKRPPAGSYPGDYSFGGGGGTSELYQQPSWQAGVVPDTLATRLPSGRTSATPMREVPDVALDADPATGFLVGETFRLRGGKTGFMLSRIGGTSLSSPLFTGMEADAAQEAGTGQLGFVNPALYQLASTGAYHDVTDSPLGSGTHIALARNEWADNSTGTGGLRTSLYTLGIDGERAAALHATAGYDDATGLGSPTGRFIAELADSTRLP
jgi:subtilase family serine protease